MKVEKTFNEKKGADTYDVSNRISDWLHDNGLDQFCDVMNNLTGKTKISIVITNDALCTKDDEVKNG